MAEMRLLDMPVVFGEPAQELPLREYLQWLLMSLWIQQTRFDSKRPYGFSIWWFDVYLAMVKHGFLEGTLDEDGFLENLPAKEEVRGDLLIREAIQELCHAR